MCLTLQYYCIIHTAGLYFSWNDTSSCVFSDHRALLPFTDDPMQKMFLYISGLDRMCERAFKVLIL